MKADDKTMTPSRVQAIRDALGMTQVELAEATGSHERTVQRWIAGDRTPRGAARRLLEQLEARGRERAAK